ncbi:hypothetical protein SAMN05660350_00448 [Geodermatophilus obscurus]|uniref:Gp5/Type VI secretion system Vgr protein OB-fold domain-containing protein n=1 Tax=Geodermatophilus obscurus TaxID=1861 RepID=A0A1M7S3H3_9ACTN|nr:phage baseplate assembly protein V [Geodermatophilus obscurus]SHN53000.1 hypothetical protein SAMN05660350_00448 [Geodermatophilus obscurus]
MSDFYGKFRGVVTDDRDPLTLGRLRARVPDVAGEAEIGWAMPCVPFTGNGSGMFVIPSIGAGVWIEFEHGDPEYPIWVGGWWGSAAELPPVLLAAPHAKTVIVTAGGHSIVLDDTPGSGGITLQTGSGQRLALSATGIELDNGQGATITLQGPKTKVNNDGLEVT